MKLYKTKEKTEYYEIWHNPNCLFLELPRLNPLSARWSNDSMFYSNFITFYFPIESYYNKYSFLPKDSTTEQISEKLSNFLKELNKVVTKGLTRRLF